MDLKNQIMFLTQKIENNFLYHTNDNFQHRTKDILIGILNLINEMIFEDDEDDNEKWYDVRVKCSPEEISTLIKDLEILELDHEITSID